MEKNSLTVAMLLVSVLVMARQISADSPWASLIPFKRVAKDPNKSYTLSEEHGPWLVLAANFEGPGADKRAHELVVELRSSFRLPAYTHKQIYDYTQPIESTTAQGERTVMRYANEKKYESYAVLVGNFRSVEDAELEATLERIKKLQPDCLDPNREASSSNRFAALSGLKRRISLNSQKRGPMGSAFATRNPLLPDQVTASRGIDSFVAKLNKGVEHSLLENPGKFTVKVATFRGSSTINQREIESIQTRDTLTDKLQVAADKAHRLTEGLRKQGFEAYEFHDRMESIVTVGSFQSEAQIRQMYKVVEHFRATQQPVPTKEGVGVKPYTVSGIPCDIEPMPIEVPRRSVAADYARRGIE